MNLALELANWVQKKPIILVRLGREKDFESLVHLYSRREKLTIAKEHSVFDNFKLPTLCLLEIQRYDGPISYLATATNKMAISTFQTRLTIKGLCTIKQSSLKSLEKRLTDRRMESLLKKYLSTEKEMLLLSAKLSVALVEILGQDSENESALSNALQLLTQWRDAPYAKWAQGDAIRLAMKVFGINDLKTPGELALKQNSESGIELIGAYLYEDNVVENDALKLPGFDLISSDVTGRALFEKQNERLVIYTANRLPLEKILGVDLIYINAIQGNIVMIQYKMLEEVEKENGSADWLFRPDKQLYNEIGRMQLPAFIEKIKHKDQVTNYRLNCHPFFFKFVKRKFQGDSPTSLLISLDHLNQLLSAPECKGPRGGIRISYEALNGNYLRETAMLGLIRSGYVGTHRCQTEVLAAIINEVAKGNKGMVLAWQQQMEEIQP